MHSEPFELSGRGAMAWMLPAIGIPAAAASAFVYAWINVYSPVAGYISLLFVAMLAAGAALPVAYAGRALKVRSVMQLRIAGAVSGASAIYFAWAFFAWVMLLKGDPDNAPSAWQFVRMPEAIWEFANLVAEDGWYSISHSLTPRGTVLWLFWAIEAAVVIGAGMFLAPHWIQGRAFCEDCSAWMVDEDALMVPADVGGLPGAVRKLGLPGIQQVKPPSEGASRWLSLGRQRCPICKDAAVYQIDDVKIVKTEKGNKAQASPIVPLSWQRQAEAEELSRVEQLLRAADTERFAALANKTSVGN